MSTEACEPKAPHSRWIDFWNAVQSVMEYRYGIAFATAIVGWTLVTYIAAPQSLFANAMNLETYAQLVLLTSLNFVVSVFCVAIFRVYNSRIQPVAPFVWLYRTIGNGQQPWQWPQFAIAAGLTLPTPITVATVYGSELSGLYKISDTPIGSSSRFVLFTISIALAFAIGWLFLQCLGNLKVIVFGSESNVANFLPFEDKDRNGLLAHLVHTVKGLQKRWLPFWPLEDIDYQLGVYLGLLTLCHFLSTRVFVSQLMHVVSVPLVIVLILWITFMLLIGLSYWLDKIRVPVLLVLFLFMVSMNLIWDGTHKLKLARDTSMSNYTASVHAVINAEASALEQGQNRLSAVKEASTRLEDLAWNAISERMKLAQQEKPQDGQRDRKRVAVVVTCPGGGIHAAAWSSYVLETLCDKYPGFRDSICIVSGVSGGSVGTLFFVSSTFADEITSADTDAGDVGAFELATKSSLEQISIGLMTDDLYGAFIPPLSIVDRGQRLEDSFKDRLPSELQASTLNHWGTIAASGRMPIVIFNATDAVSGRRVLFDSLPTPMRKSNITLTSRAYNYRELLDVDDITLDISPMTAARASASFPYVSTFTSIEGGNQIGRSIAVGDGGYVDNEGIVSAVDWIQFLLERWSSKNPRERPFDQILLLRIMPSVNSDSLEPPTAHWLIRNLRWLTGPIETIANVRATSQAERGNMETDLAALYLSSPSINTLPPIGPIDDHRLRKTAEAVTDKVYGMSPVEKLSKAANRTREDAARERYLNRMKEDDPHKWEQIKVIPKPNTSAPTMAMVANPEESKIDDSPVLVIELPFEIQSPTDVVPLNWKLTNEQKKWYQKAWSRVEANQVEDLQVLQNMFGE